MNPNRVPKILEAEGCLGTYEAGIQAPEDEEPVSASLQASGHCPPALPPISRCAL
jgi:hypothetical protein